MAEEIQYTTGLAKGGWLLGKMEFNNAEYKQAIQHMLPSVALWRGLDRPYELAAALLNNGMAAFESGPGSTAAERAVIRWLAEQAGYGPGADGVLTSGGSLGNLTALLVARFEL